MKIDKEYAFDLLKKLEELYPKELNGSNEEKERAHLIYLVEEGFAIETEASHPLTPYYRITSDGLNLLSNQTFAQWYENQRINGKIDSK
ncbi:unnamed protein product [Commensalibacter communis]|uniref:hypothetical protein n=1 Tax=Commensalibacter communis TaxID=2972786 RepID=UPI0022FF9CC3|nr:hypothetical protein [Commensalibacter communis]CAI3953776.1 unnamed protein product [Commensalibacter communis]CAI3959043.1 unnamed protein product [Commensalibacter communis]